jgi:hypothetical protein
LDTTRDEPASAFETPGNLQRMGFPPVTAMVAPDT